MGENRRSGRGQGGGANLGGGRGRRRSGEGGGVDDAFGRGRRGRMFEGGELRLVLLTLIAEQPRHGYELIRATEERTAGAYVPSPGVVYPTLTLITELGWVTVQAIENGRKLYAVTPDGEVQLEERATEVAVLFSRIEAANKVRARTEVAPVRRAMENLRNVLDYQLAGGLEEERMHEAVAMIDEVARKIERL